MQLYEELRKKYPKGTKIELISMNDAQAPPAGTIGIIFGVDGGGNILVNWSNGSTLSLIPEVDEFRII